MNDAARRVDIRPDHLEIVRNVLRQHLPTRRVVAFGSRATWTAKEYSDLDLAILGDEPVPLDAVAALAEGFGESDLPFKVDVAVWVDVNNHLRQVIRRDGVDVQLPEAGTHGSNAPIPADRLHIAPKNLGLSINDASTTSLEEMCELIVDCPHFTPEWTDQGYRVIRNQNIRNGRLNLSNPSFTHKADFERRIKRARPQPGDIIFTREAPMGEVCMLPEDLECCVGQRQVLLRARGDVDGTYLFYALQSPSVRRQIFWNEGTGSTVSNVRIPALKALLIPRLGSSERFAGECLEAIDAKIELNRRMNETLEAMARALFKSWFVDFEPVRAKMAGRHTGLPETIANLFPSELVDLGQGDHDIPIGWSIVPLNEVADFLNGLALQKYPTLDAEHSLPVIKIAELRNGVTAKTTRASNAVPTQYVINDGDFLFSWSGSLMAKFWTGGPGALNQHLFKVTSSDYPTWFFTHWVQHHLPTFQEIAAGKATTMGHIQRHHLAEATTACPPTNVLPKLDPTMSALLRRSINIELESRMLASIRDELLPKLVSGEIRVQQAEKALAAIL